MFLTTGSMAVVGYVALVVTMVLCGLVAVQTTTFNLPVWLIIGLVCWVLHSAYLFTRWKKEHKK